jgi:O-antigen/teichoic acid export membrane protein
LSSTNRKILTLISGTALAQVVTFLFSPVLSRFFSPAEYGEFAMYMGAVNAVQVIACGRYEMAVVLADDDGEALNIVALSLLATLGFAFFCLFGALGFYIYSLSSPAFSHKYPDMQHWLWAMPLFILLLGAYMAFNQWLIRKESYSEMSISRFGNSATTSILQTILGFIKMGANGILLGAIAGQAVYTGLLYYYSQKQAEKESVAWRLVISWEKVKTAAARYQLLPRTTLFQSLLEMFQSNALSFLLPFFYSAVEGGFYFRTLIIFQAPVALIAQALAQVAYREAALLQREGSSLRPLVFSTLKKSALIGLPICLGLLAVGPWVFSTFFGKEWYEAGVYARILAVWMYLDFLRIPLAQIAIVIQKQRALLQRSLIGTAVLIATISAGYYISTDVHLSLYLLSGGMTLFTAYLLTWFVRSVK